MGVFEDLNNAGLRAIALKPQWVDQTSYEDLPNTASDGVYLEASPKMVGHVALRENVAFRTSRVQIGVVNLTTTVYTIEVNGNPVVYDTAIELPANLAALLSGIVDAINADVTVSPIVTASVDPDTSKTILIQGDSGTNYGIDATAVGGSGTIATITADAVSCDLRLFTTPGGLIREGSEGNENGWVSPPNGSWSVDRFGWMERFDVAGCDRGYLLLTNIDGHASDGLTVELQVRRVMIGPAVLEATT